MDLAFYQDRLRRFDISDEDMARFEKLYPQEGGKGWKAKHMINQRTFFKRLKEMAKSTIYPTVGTVDEQLSQARDVMERGGRMVALDLEWSQGGVPFVYEVGMTVFWDTKFVTSVNIMIRHPNDPKANPEHPKFREDIFPGGSLIATPEEAAIYLREQIARADMFALHGHKADAQKLYEMGCSIEGRPAIDTFEIAEALLPDQGHRLIDLYRHFGNDDRVAKHNGGFDAKMTAKVVQGFIESHAIAV